MTNSAAPCFFLIACLSASAGADDLELTEAVSLPECHSIGWVRTHTQPAGTKTWDWRLSDDQWRAAVRTQGEGKREEVRFALWIPEGVGVVRGVVAITGHGSGEYLYRHPDLRKLARELRLAVFQFVGNPLQRGFWPRSLLYERLKDLGAKSRHPELEHAPLFLYGHSNGTGFSAIFPATEGERVWAWVSMRPGTTPQVAQPGAAQVPGLVIFGEVDPFFARPSQRENIAVVETMRKEHGALWNFAVEPKTGHGPGAKTWPLVFSFLRHTFAARVPTDADPRGSPVPLRALRAEQGLLGEGWDADRGGYQELRVASQDKFQGDKSTASWLINADYADDWRTFQRTGEVPKR